MSAAIIKKIIEIMTIMNESMNILFAFPFLISPFIIEIKRMLPARAAAR